MVIVLQKRVEQLENTIAELVRKLEVLEATRHGRITESDLKIQEDSNTGLPDSPPEKVNGDESEVNGHLQADVVEDCEVTVDIIRENIMEEEDEIEQTVKDDRLEETVLTCVEDVNGQENKLDQVGEDEGLEETVLTCVEDVNREENKLDQVGEDEGLEETVLTCVEDVNRQEIKL